MDSSLDKSRKTFRLPEKRVMLLFLFENFNMFTDTHCHLADLAFRLPEILTQAHDAGVSGFVVPATQPNDWQAVLSMNSATGVRAVAVGLHPWFAENQGNFLADLATILAENPLVWVGEIGLDALIQIPKEIQLSVFERQILLAKQFNRPIIIHNVRSTALIVNTIKQLKFECGGIVHAFSGSIEEANILIKLGFKIGLGSLLLNSNAKKAHRAAIELPLEHVLLETDSPYMQPNHTNTPANVAKIAKIVAKSRQISLMDLAMQLEQNLLELLID